MKVRPAIAGLREDDAPHRLAQTRLGAAFDLWREQVRAVLADLPHLAERGAGGCPRSAPAFRGAGGGGGAA